MSSRWGRFARGWVTALLSVLIAALAHVGGGGAQPSLIAVVLSLAFAGMASVLLAGKTVSLTRLMIAVGFSQGVFHTLFALGGGAAVTQTGHHGALSYAIVGTVDHGHEGMLPAHALAAAATAVVLRLGEGALSSLVALARDGLQRVLAPAAQPVVMATPVRMRVAASVESTACALDALVGSLGLRGPPRAH